MSERRWAAGMMAGILFLPGLRFDPAPARAGTETSPDSVALSSPSEVPTAARSDSTDALNEYLGTLAARTRDEFLLQELSISDAEVDSLVRAWEESGEGPAGRPGSGVRPRTGWDAHASLGDFRYNRVEGANLMGDARVTAPTPHLLEAFGRAGFGWASREATWRMGLRAGVPRLPGDAELEIAHGRDVWAYGAGGVPGNSFLALTVGRDQDDYYRARGWTVTLDASPGPLRSQFTWTAEEHESLDNTTDFTLFDEGSHFRVNPPVHEGRSRRVELSLGAGSTVEDRWAAEVRGVVAGRALGGDFDYESATVTLRARRPLAFGDVLRAELDGGFVTERAPYQALRFLGGTRRLRGYRVNELPTLRSLHLSVDYALGTSPLRYVPYVRRFRVQPVPFVDTALILKRAPLPDGRDPDSPQWRFAAGLGLQYNVFAIPGGSGQVRLDVARRLDRGDDNMTYRLGFTLAR